MDQQTENKMRRQLIGRRLSAVTFVMDYVQLQFDPPPTINALTPITVTSGNSISVSGDDSFRNRLCGQITKIVAAVQVVDGEAFSIAFDDGSRIAISLHEEHYRCPEAVNFFGEGGFWFVI